MERLKMHGKLIAGVFAAAALVGCEANGGFPGGDGGGNGGGDGNNGGLESCLLPFGPSSIARANVMDGCMVCSVSNPENVIDSDPDTAATFSVLSLGTGTPLLYVGFDAPESPDPGGPKFPAGNIAGVVLEFPGLVDTTILPTITLITKLDMVDQERFQFSGLLGAQVLGAASASGRFFLGEATTKDFDAVELQINVSGVNVLNSVKDYAHCGDATEATDLPYILL